MGHALHLCAYVLRSLCMNTLTVPATLESLALISDFVVNAAAQANLDERASWQVQLAVDEAATNIIQHGYDPAAPGDIELVWRVDNDHFIITLRDHGHRFDPDSVPVPDIEQPLEERHAGGLGIYLMNRLMDSVRYEFDEQHGNLLTMTKNLHPVDSAVRIVELSGRLDAAGTPAAIARIKMVVGEVARYLLLDMAQVTFLSSSGLRALLLVRKDLHARGGELRLCALPPQVRDVFEITGFTQVFEIYPTRAEALAAFAQGGADAHGSR